MIKFNQNIIRGICKAVDLFCAERSTIEVTNGLQQDYDALKGDWQNVGRDIQWSIDEYGRQQRESSFAD